MDTALEQGGMGRELGKTRAMRARRGGNPGRVGRVHHERRVEMETEWDYMDERDMGQNEREKL